LRKYIFVLLLFPLLFLHAQSVASLAISEVMFYPQGSDNEFIEIYNFGLTPIDIDSFKIKYNTSNPDIILKTGSTSILAPGSYAVILQGNYDFANGLYKDKIPSGALILKIADNYFGSTGMSNTTGRPICLLNKNNDTLDYYSYSADNAVGYSDEKIKMNKDASPSNWSNSLVLNGTPGYRNSITPYEHNLEVNSISVSPSLIYEGGSAAISAKVLNKGSAAADSFSINIYNDANYNSIPEASELLVNKDYSSLAANDSVETSSELNSLAAGKYNIIAEVIYGRDENKADNIKQISFTVHPKGSSYNDAVINEFMYAPIAGQPEWVEIFNKSQKQINLKNWRIGDKTNRVVITSKDILLQPNSFLIITKDSSILSYYKIPVEVIKTNLPSLNNDGDSIVLTDSLGATIDSLAYLPAWGGNINGKSLERIDKDESSVLKSNWGSSISGFNATPGLVNSIALKQYDLALTDFKTKYKTINITGQNELSVTLRNYGKQTANNYAVKIYADINNDTLIQQNELIKTITGSTIAYKDSITLTMACSPYNAGANRFFACIEFLNDEDTLNNKKFTEFTAYKINEERNDIVINEIIYAPALQRPEWIEVYNNSLKEINLKGYKLSDNTDTSTIITKSLILKPNEYLVIAADSSLLKDYTIPSQFITAKFSSLNNSGDKVILIDSLNRTIDSLEYLPAWGGSNGKSLERIEPSGSSITQSNWSESKDKNGATPGKINSVAVKQYDLALTNAQLKYKSISITDKNELIITALNNGKQTVNNYAVKIYADINNDTLIQQTELIKTITGPILTPKDSATFTANCAPYSSGINRYFAYVDFVNDEDITNNKKYAQFTAYKINEERNDLVINEIMYAPALRQPEWIEVYNNSQKEIDLKNYKLSDNTDTATVITKSLVIKPKEYLVIAADSSLIKDYAITSQFVCAKFPALNNSGDKVILIDSLNRTIDSVEYQSSWGGSGGKSLERIEPSGLSIKQSNWLESKDKNGATPGKKNSVSACDYDLQIADAQVIPQTPNYGGSVGLKIKVKNAGIYALPFTLKIYEDVNNDTLPDALLYSGPYPKLNPTDSAIVELNPLVSNIHRAMAVIINLTAQGDENEANNYLYKKADLAYSKSAVLINEIMYDPTNGEPEWIEFYNNTPDTINFKGWSINDVYATPEIYKTTKDFLALPGEYFLVTKDSSIYNYHRNIPAKILFTPVPVLNNDKDGVVLKDAENNIIDSVLYGINFESKQGFSLERKNLNNDSNLKDNWGVSTDAERSTPGRKNSISAKVNDLTLLKVFANFLAPQHGDSLLVAARIKNSGSASASAFSIEYYFSPDTNKSALQLFETQSYPGTLNAADSIDLFASRSFKAVNEKYLIAAKIKYAKDEDSVNNYASESIRIKNNAGSLLVNEIMYNPALDKPEWIEAVNVSGQAINLNGLSVSDYSATTIKAKIANKDLYVQPNEYFIIARDSSFYKYYPSVNVKIIIASFGQLNNSEDGVRIYDFDGSEISSVFYKSSWTANGAAAGGTVGFSLERVSLSVNGNDSLNWKTSISPAGCTPGQINSVVGVPSYKRNSVVINEIMNNPGSGNSEYIEFLNVSGDTINIAGWQIKNLKGDVYRLSDARFVLADHEYYVLAADTLINSKYSYMQNNKNIKICGTANLGLDNSEGMVLLKDLNNNTIDSVYYTSGWLNKKAAVAKDKSIEKINPLLDGATASNWGLCCDPAGGTPGKVNSLFAAINQTRTSAITVAPNPFSPDNDGYEDNTVITYSLQHPAQQVRVRIYDNKGRLLRTLFNNQQNAYNGSIIFNGRDEDGNALRIGIYIILLEALDSSSSVKDVFKTVVVIARKL
jgi:hypothetical protein